jgi:glutamate-ammonia-ligase adenylyltransferase
MNRELEQWFDSPALDRWLAEFDFRDQIRADRATSNLKSLAATGLTVVEFLRLVQLLRRGLDAVADPDAALNNLERFSQSQNDSAKELVALLDNEPLLFGLLTLFSDTQYFSDLLRDPENYRWLKLSIGREITKSMLDASLSVRMYNIAEMEAAMRELRLFKQREFLRIVYGDLVLGYRIEQVTEQISQVAAAVCHAAIVWSHDRLSTKYGQPMRSDRKKCRFVVMGMGKLGGYELNYSSDIDLVAVFESRGRTNGKNSKSNLEFFTQLTRDFIKLVGGVTELGAAFRVDFRLRPHGAHGAICSSTRSIVQYYDLEGRTWERQALIKAKPIAGDIDLGFELLDKLEPWIYQSSFNRSDITGMKSLKRKIERRALQQGEDRTNIKTGYGGIRDVEFVIQFMQLLNGYSLPKLRSTNTLRAIGRLERGGCLTHDEANRLADNYRWLRKLEHRLQISFNQQTHILPNDPDELAAIAVRMNCQTRIHQGSSDKQSAAEVFFQQLKEVTDTNRTILNHLLHGAFGGANVIGESDEDEEVPPEVDLILEPDPTNEMIETVLHRFDFRDRRSAFERLMELSQEKTKFLSSRRCKHFLAAIAPALLEEVNRTPEPDQTLNALSSVSDSLGAKGVLWELFSLSPPTLNLFVRLCASCDYLATILKSNPGMIDELADALQLESLPTRQRLESTMQELSKGAVDIDLIVSSFKSTQHMRIGIRDILGHDTIQESHRSLSDVADICLAKVVEQQFDRLFSKHGDGFYESQLRAGCGLDETIPFAILAMGKLGGREPNYHSDLDVVFLYAQESEFEEHLADGITSQFFFSELAAGITRFVSNTTDRARLYEIDSRLRPTGKSGSLAVSLIEFDRYFQQGTAQLWERQSLCRARTVLGNVRICEQIGEVVAKVLSMPWHQEMRAEIREMRTAMERDASERNLKRGQGGTVDIEFIIQMLQLKHGPTHRSVFVTGTVDAIQALVAADLMSSEDGDFLAESYQLLRSVESRLRLMNTTARHDLPIDPMQLEKLAYLINYPNGQALERKVTQCRKEVRQRFEQFFETGSH